MSDFYFIGIKGKGMRALAKNLTMAGNKVEGDDIQEEKDEIYYELKNMKIDIQDVVNYENVNDKEVITTAAVNPDKLKAFNNYTYYNEYISKITKENYTVSVCGSFGKTTTTTFLYKILDNIIGCNCIIGDGTGIYKGKNKTLVLESCEYKEHFLIYDANDVIITNIGFEHLDYYKTYDAIVNAFVSFANKCNGNKIIFGDIKNLDYKLFTGNVLTFGFGSNNGVCITNYKVVNNETKIELTYKDNSYSFIVPIKLGRHQVLDLVACISYCLVKQYDIDKIKKSINTITLPKYRFVEENINGILVVSDFCAHYAGMSANIAEIKKRYPNKRINVIFEPIAYNRSINTFSYICDALNSADFVYVCDIVPIRETNIEKINFSVNNYLEKIKNSKYWDKKIDLYFNNDDIVVIFGEEIVDGIKSKIKMTL